MFRSALRVARGRAAEVRAHVLEIDRQLRNIIFQIYFMIFRIA